MLAFFICVRFVFAVTTLGIQFCICNDGTVYPTFFYTLIWFIFESVLWDHSLVEADKLTIFLI